MKSPIVAIAFSDLHYHNWKQHNENNRRLDLGSRVLEAVSTECQKHGVPALFLGDLFHNDQHVDNLVLNHFIDAYIKYFEGPLVKFLAISGNHDQYHRNTYKNRSISYITTFSRLFPKTFRDMDYRIRTTKDAVITGIPYTSTIHADIKAMRSDRYKKGKVDSKSMSILMLHGNLPGAKDPSGYTMGGEEDDLYELISDFDLVLAGHIHKFQQLSSNCIMLGAPYHQRISDMGCPMGISRIYLDGTVEFVDLELPEYKYLPLSRTTPPDKTHYWIPMPQEDGEHVSDEEISVFKPNEKPLKIAKQYLKVTGVKDKGKEKALINILKS